MSLGDSPQSEFDLSELGTSIPEDAPIELAHGIQDIVENIRERMVSEGRVVDVLRDGESIYADDSAEQEDPEPFTKGTVIEPILEDLDYPYLTREAGDYADERGEQADYSVPFRDYTQIDSERLLIEAEPINKELEQDKHGLGQVRSWLRYRPFEADYGIATDGLRWVLLKYDEDTHSFNYIREVNLQPVFVTIYENLATQRRPLDEVLDEENLELLHDFIEGFQYDNLISIASEVGQVIKQKKKNITEDFYQEYIELVFGITDEDSEGRDTEACLVGDGVTAPDGADEEDRRLFSVELMNRLMFIKFLEDSEVVQDGLLRELKQEHEDGNHLSNFYRTFVQPLIYDVFNTHPEQRPDQIQEREEFATIPYLNGGLFRENRENEIEYNVSDPILEQIVEFLESYHFSTTAGVGELDPSVLGTVFEKTINYLAGEQGTQKELGAYYTPDDITQYTAKINIQPVLFERFKNVLVDEWGWREGEVDQYDDILELIDGLSPGNEDIPKSLLNEVDEFYVLDPACGSGHFLTSVMGEILAIREALWDRCNEDSRTYSLKKNTVLHNLYGVEIVGSGVEISKLRLWLSIMADVSEDDTEELEAGDLALPNVAFNVRQGNSLVGYTNTNRLREVDKESGTQQQPLYEYSGETIEELVQERQEKVNEYKDLYGAEAGRLEQEIQEADEEYNQELNEKLLRDFRDAGITIDVKLDEIRSPGLDTDSIHKFGIRLSDPLSDNKKEELDDRFRTTTGMRINPGSGGYVSITFGHDYLNNTPEGRIQEIIEDIGEEAIDSVDMERYLTMADLEETSYLHWPLEFYDVFDNQGGFDIVIGNPPYGIDIQDSESALSDYPDENHSAMVFTTRSESLVRDGGKIAFVVPKLLTYGHQWMDAREDLLEKDLDYLIDLQEAFEGVKSEQIILSLEKNEVDDSVVVGRRESGSLFEKEYSQSRLTRQCFYMWVDEDNEDLVAKLQSYRTLKNADYATATKGIDYFDQHRTHTSDGLYGLRGDNIAQFRLTGETRFDESLTERSDVDPEVFDQDKLVWQDIIAHVKNPVPRIILQAAVDYEGAYIADTAIFATSEDYSLEYLCGLMNSNLFSWFTYNLIHNRAIRTMHFTPAYFYRLPAPPEDDDDQIENIETLTKDIQELDGSDPSEVLEKYEKLNQAVYELYQLFEEEQELIESETPARRETLVND